MIKAFFLLRYSDMRVLASLALAVVIAAPAAPVLGISGDRFTVNGSPRFLLFVSYFDAMRLARAGAEPGGALDADFRYIASHGFDGIRVFPNWYHYASGARADGDALFTKDGSIRSAAWPIFISVLDRAAANGLIVDVSFSRETISDLSVDAYIAQLEAVAAKLKGAHPHAFFDLQNEFPIHMSERDAARALAAVRSADPARIVTVSIDSGSVNDPGDAGRLSARLRLPVAAYHESRDPDEWFTEAYIARIVGALRTGLGAEKVPIYLQEPTAIGTMCPPRCLEQDWDDEPSHARDAARAAERAGAAAWTFHTRSTFDLSNTTFRARLEADPKQRAAFEAVGR
jgi:hypothetical protein